MNPSIKRGYVKGPDVGAEKRRKYPFHLLAEGDYIDPPYKMEVASKVLQGMRYWNRAHGGLLHMSRYPNGTKDHPYPHVVVGWPVGAVKRTRQKK